eukprot:scaffold1267_cov171-Amphora_coffeaeformis.AAC.3
MSSPNNQSSTPILLAAAAVAALSVTCCLWYQRRLLARDYKTLLDEALRQANERRKEERTGRIRAEVRLRQVSKQLSQAQQSSTIPSPATIAADAGSSHAPNDSFLSRNGRAKQTTTMLLESIGFVTSPYTKRMGTPRQPQLVPSSRGFIEFTCPAATLDGIEAYSHVWVIFEFHANTNVDKSKTKIRPPRAGGLRVGQLATRSPHRPNCLGLSLIQIGCWDPATRRLHVRGLDLVNGTPVYDVKPVTPFDQVVPVAALKVPHWVESDDSLANVTFSPTAEVDLQQRVTDGRLAPLYTTQTDGFVAARQSLVEILAQDPRSSHKGLKNNARGMTTTTTEVSNSSYNLVFGQCQVFFSVHPDQVVVERIDEIDFESATFVDGVPLIMASEQKD